MRNLSEHCVKLFQYFLFLLLIAPNGEAGTLSVVGQNRWVHVAYVYDGDTLRTAKGERIRLLGINSPEVPNNDQPGQSMGGEAKQRLTELVDGKLVQLKMDKEKQDIYGRTLAHIYLRNGIWINAQMVREGLAHVYTFAPNFRRVNELLQAEVEARNSKRGIWKTERFRMLDGNSVSKRHIGQFRVARGTVSTIRKWQFRLDKLQVSVPRKYRQWFKNEPLVHNGQKVTIRGTIRLSGKGHLYIVLHSPADLEAWL
jgi:endonuclease YncB( thermonuclease family)